MQSNYRIIYYMFYFITSPLHWLLKIFFLPYHFCIQRAALFSLWLVMRTAVPKVVVCPLVGNTGTGFISFEPALETGD